LADEPRDYSGLDRRQVPRIHARLNIDYALETHLDNAGKVRLTSTWSNNIGECGICLVTEEPYSIGSSLLLMVRFPGEPQPVPAIAKVIWWKHLQNDPNFHVGCEFVEIAPADRKRLMDFLNAKA